MYDVCTYAIYIIETHIRLLIFYLVMNKYVCCYVDYVRSYDNNYIQRWTVVLMPSYYMLTCGCSYIQFNAIWNIERRYQKNSYNVSFLYVACVWLFIIHALKVQYISQILHIPFMQI
jgi:hypothetical protein